MSVPTVDPPLVVPRHFPLRSLMTLKARMAATPVAAPAAGPASTNFQAWLCRSVNAAVDAAHGMAETFAPSAVLAPSTPRQVVLAKLTIFWKPAPVLPATRSQTTDLPP